MRWPKVLRIAAFFGRRGDKPSADKKPPKSKKGAAAALSPVEESPSESEPTGTDAPAIRIEQWSVKVKGGQQFVHGQFYGDPLVPEGQKTQTGFVLQFTPPGCDTVDGKTYIFGTPLPRYEKWLREKCNKRIDPARPGIPVLIEEAASLSSGDDGDFVMNNLLTEGGEEAPATGHPKKKS